MDFIKYIVIACVFVLIIHLHVCMKKKKNVVQVVTPSEPSEERETIEAFLSCMNVITKGNGENNNIPQLLEIIGKYYGAERAYLFEVGEKSDFGTYRGEWCATGVESHEFFFGEEEGSEEKTKDFLDKMPKEISEQYSKRNLKPNSLPDFSKMGENNAMMKNYDENGDFVMKSLDDIKFSNPLMFLTLKAMKINGLISTLIKSEGAVHALLGIENPTKHRDSLELLHAISEFVIYRIDRDRDLIKEYLVDALTGVNSARYIDFWKKNCEPEMPFTVIVADCNYLKQYNDLYGHECGDLLLSKAGEIFKSCAPRGCRIIRSGGDEFLLLCDNTDEKEAAKVIEAIRKAASKDNVKGYPISIALGSYTTNDGNFSFEEARAIADSRMYQNKSTMKDHQECTLVK